MLSGRDTGFYRNLSQANTWSGSNLVCTVTEQQRKKRTYRSYGGLGEADFYGCCYIVDHTLQGALNIRTVIGRSLRGYDQGRNVVLPVQVHLWHSNQAPAPHSEIQFVERLAHVRQQLPKSVVAEALIVDGIRRAIKARSVNWGLRPSREQAIDQHTSSFALHEYICSQGVEEVSCCAWSEHQCFADKDQNANTVEVFRSALWTTLPNWKDYSSNVAAW